MADNMVDYFHVMTNDEIDAFEQAYNLVNADKLNVGKLPFMRRKEVLETIQMFLEDMNRSETGWTDENGIDIDGTMEVLEVILSRVRLEPLDKAKVKKWRKRIRDRIESR